MRRPRLTIAKRIGMGYGLFIFFALVVVIITNRALDRSRTINETIERVYSPSVDALVHLRNVLVNAHMLVKHWALVESKAEAPEKRALITLTSQELPALLDRIDTLSANWGSDEVALFNATTAEMGDPSPSGLSMARSPPSSLGTPPSTSSWPAVRPASAWPAC